MRGTSELPIVLKSDSDKASENATSVEEMDILLEVIQTKESPLNLIYTKCHQ